MAHGIRDELRADAPADSHGQVGMAEYAAALAFFTLFYLLYFSPVLLGDRLLAPGDGAVSYLPAVAREWSLWIDGLFAGYPAFADTQQFPWYPLRLFGSHYNALVVSAYVIAAFCTYGLARLLSGSVLAAIVAGLVYSGSGFMTAHLGHLSIIHSAAWIPLTLWGLEALARNRGWTHVALVASGIALSFLGGHPQIWVYGLILAGAYAVWRSTIVREDTRRPDVQYLARCALGVAAGLGLAGVQLLPFVEFTHLAARGQWTYADYSSYSLPPIQLFMAVFPDLFGNTLGGFSAQFGAPSLTELSFYAGIVTLALASLAPWSRPGRRHAWFWIGVAALAVMYMTADATPLGPLGFRTPVLGSFRASGRAGILYILAVALLAAIALGSLQRRELAGMRLRRALSVALAAVALITCVLYFSYDAIAAKAQDQHVTIPDFLHNKAVWLPIVLLAAGAVSCACIARWPRTASALLAALVAIDMASFGWFCEWRLYTTAKTAALTPAWRSLVAAAQLDHARILPLPQHASTPAFPDRNLLYGLPSASGYVSLMPERFGELAGVGTGGVYPKFPADSPFWDLLGVRWLLDSAQPMLDLGSGCGSSVKADDLTVPLPAGATVAALVIESQMACGGAMENDVPVLQIGIGAASSLEMLAGRDTSEAVIDLPREHAPMHHRRANVAASYAVKGGSAHWYRTRLDLPVPTVAESLHLHMVAPGGVRLHVRAIGVIGSDGKQHQVVVQPNTMGPRWRPLSPPLPEYPSAVERTDFAGRAWLVSGIMEADDAQAMETILSGMTSFRRPFDPLEVALVDPRVASDLPLQQPWGKAGVVGARRISADHWEFAVDATRSALLVISQMDYPGWQARVDGKPVPVLRADYAFQAVAVPAGRSMVDLRFLPRSLLVGALLSGLGLLVVAACVGLPWRARRARPVNASRAQ
jgi:hypothetical protein